MTLKDIKIGDEKRDQRLTELEKEIKRIKHKLSVINSKLQFLHDKQASWKCGKYDTE